MKSFLTLRRAALLGLMLGATGCDVYMFVADPKPKFEQTWNVAVDSTSISVASLLPPGNLVTILPDSSGFALTVSGATITRRVGSDCGQCETLNGTTAPKPAFTLTAANSTPLPQDVASAVILDGTINVSLTNNMSFDPLFVRTNPGPQTQGFMLIVIRSGSLVLGRDSVNGATTPWPAGTLLTRAIDIGTGTAASALTVEVTIDSPSGDHNEFINANGTMNASAAVQSLIVASVGLNVPNRQLISQQETLDLDIDAALVDHVISGTLLMTITNPFAVTGNVNVRFNYGSGEILKTISLPTGPAQLRTVTLDSTEMANILKNTVTMTITGSVSSAAPIVVTPRQVITIANRMRVVIRTGGGGI